jgi:hypothetical protein
MRGPSSRRTRRVSPRSGVTRVSRRLNSSRVMSSGDHPAASLVGGRSWWRRRMEMGWACVGPRQQGGWGRARTQQRLHPPVSMVARHRRTRDASTCSRCRARRPCKCPTPGRSPVVHQPCRTHEYRRAVLGRPQRRHDTAAAVRAGEGPHGDRMADAEGEASHGRVGDATGQHVFVNIGVGIAFGLGGWRRRAAGAAGAEGGRQRGRRQAWRGGDAAAAGPWHAGPAAPAGGGWGL